MINNNRKYNIIGSFLIVIAVLGYLSLNEDARGMIFFMSFFLLLGLAFIMLGYLKGNSIITKNTPSHIDFINQIENIKSEFGRNISSSKEYKNLLNELKEVKESIQLSSKSISDFTDDDKENILNHIKNKISETLDSEFLKAIEKKYAPEIQKSSQIAYIEDKCQNTENRLRNEIEALSRRGNINLIIGVLTTVVATTILASTVAANVMPTDTKSMLIHFLPRLSLSVFIEFFSFFFLKLYKTSLSEIKYFQNELTNIESKFVSLIRVIQNDDKDVMAKILSNLVETERNFILKKDESTVDLEIARYDHQNIKDILAAVSGVFKKK